MLRHLALLPSFIAQFMKMRMAYRLDFFVSVVTSLLSTALGFVFISVVFSKVPTLEGWSFYEILFIYGFSLMPIGIFSMVSWNLWEFGSKYVIEGNFDRVLLRPLHSLYQIYFESVRIETIPDILLGLGIVIYSSNQLGLILTPSDYAAMLFFVLCGALIILSFFSLLAAINFWAEDRIGLAAPLFNMIPLGRYPITLYNGTVKFLLTTIFPFAYVAFFPATFLLGHSEFQSYVLLTPVVAIVLWLITLQVWRRGVRRYGSVGN